MYMRVCVYICEKGNRSRTQPHDNNNTTQHTTGTPPQTATRRTTPSLKGALQLLSNRSK